MRADIRARSVPFFLLVVLAIFLSPGLSAALSIDVTVLPDATVGIPYSYTVPVSGATQAFLCGAQNQVELPMGISVGSVGPSCIVGGSYPNAAGTFSFVIVLFQNGAPPVQQACHPDCP